MSKALSYGDFVQARERALRAAVPAAHRKQQTWLADWAQAISRMQYLRTEQEDLTDSLKSIIQIRCKLKKPNLNLDLVRPDIENLWIHTSAKSEDAAHAFTSNASGFEFAFYAVAEGGYITGSITIARHS